MITDIDWTLTGDKAAGDHLTHFSECHEVNENEINEYLNLVLDRAIGIIAQSIHDDARYLLFTWNSETSTLDIVSTDDQKSHDASESVKLRIQHWQESPKLTAEEQTENIHYWIKDYLTTSSEFLHFSLIAMFSCGDRAKTQLL